MINTDLLRIFPSDENSKILHEQEIEKTLITMLGSNDEHVVVATCEAIASLSSNLAAKDTFGKSGKVALRNIALR